MSLRSNSEREGRGEIKRVETDFAIDIALSSRVNDRRPRSREPAIAPSRSSKVSLLPRSDTREVTLIFCISRSDGFEIEQRGEIDVARLQADAGLGLCRPGLGGALRFGVKAGSRQADFQPQRRMPHTAHRSLELRRALPGRDHAVEPEQAQQRTAAIRRQFGFDADFAALEFVEIERAQRRGIRPRRQRRETFQLRRIEIERGVRVGAIGMFGILVEREREFEARGARACPHRGEPRRNGRRQRRHKSGDLTERRGARVQRQLSGRIDPVECACAFHRDAAGLADFQLIERERLRTVAELRRERMQFLAGRNGAVDIQRQLNLLRPFGLRAEQRTHEGGCRVEIEAFRLQRRIDPGAAACGNIANRHPPFNGAAVDLGLDGVDCNAIGGHIDVAAQAHRLLAAKGQLAAALQPGRQCIGIG